MTFRSDQGEAEKSAFRFQIYRMACRVLEMPTRKGRSERLEQIPEQSREAVKIEAERIFNYRRNSK